MAIGTAFRAFFAALFDSQKSSLIQQALDGSLTPGEVTAPLLPSSTAKSAGAKTAAADSSAAVAKPASTRSDAVTLLAALQREARLVDLIQENLAAYSDAQIGAAPVPV